MNPPFLIIPLDLFSKENDSVLELADARIVLTKSMLNEAFVEIRDNRGVYTLPLPAFSLVIKQRKERPRATLNRALTIFKLFKDKVVTANVIFIANQDGEREIDYLPHYRYFYDDYQPFILQTDEEEGFKHFWMEFITLKPSAFPVYRFNLAVYRPFLRDRLTDYAISLESLLVPDSGAGEISYKFRLRGSRILGETESPDSKEQIFKDLKELYTIRSKIVHEGWNPKDSKDWQGLLDKARNYVREAIIYFHRHNCINSTNKRKALIESKTIFY